MSNVKAPQIVGAKDPLDPIEESKKKDELNNDVLHMDIPLQQAVELPTDKDIAGMVPDSDAIMMTEEVNDNSVQSSVNATVQKTKRAKKKQKVLDELEGNEAAQGSPTPDVLLAFVEEQRRQNSLLREMMLDLRTFRAETAPMQAEKIIPDTTVTKQVEDPVRPNDFIEQVEHATPASVPVSAPPMFKRVNQSPFVSEQESYTNRFKKAFDAAFNMNTDSVNARARADSSSGVNVSASHAFFF